jgi:hypothetical protein
VETPPQIIDLDDPQPRKPRNTPPPRGNGTSGKESTTIKRSPADKKLQAQLSATYQTIGLAIGTVGIQLGKSNIQLSGESFATNGDAIAAEWMRVADTNPKVKEALKRITQTSALGGLVGLHLSCLFPIIIPLLPPQLQMAFAMAGMPVDDSESPSSNGDGSHIGV